MNNDKQHLPIIPSSQLPELVGATIQPMEYNAAILRGRSLPDYLFILRNRKWWVISTFCLVVTLVAAYCLFVTPVYRVSTVLQLTQDNPGSQVSVDDKLSRLTGNDSMEKFQKTQYKILQSQSLAERIIKGLHLEVHDDFKDIKEKYADKGPEILYSQLVEQFRKNLEVNPIRNSFLAEVAYQSADAEMAKKVVNSIADEYMFLSIDRRNESFNLVRNWLDRQLQEMATKVQQAQQKLYKFGQEKDIYSMEDKDNVIVQKFVDLNGLLTKAQADKMVKEAQYRQIQAKGPNAPLVVNNPLVVKLREEWILQKSKVSSLRRVYLSGHPELQAATALLQELKGRLDAEVQRLMDSIRADYEAAVRTEKLLADSFTEQKDQVAKLQDNLTDFQILKRDAQTNEQLYQALLARVKEANIASTMVPTNVAVIDPGKIPAKPYKPNTALNLALASFLGLTLGIGLALLVENFDDSIKSVDDLEKYCGLPSLGVLPLMATNGAQPNSLVKKKVVAALEMMPSFKKYHRQEHNAAPQTVTNLDLIVYEDPRSHLAEALRHAQTSIMLSVSGRPPGVLLITSANPSEGKSTVSCNLGISFALNGRSTVIIDCDLRKPRLHKAFSLQAQPGVTNYLSGHATLEKIVRPTHITNLSFIGAGAHSPSPANLLHSEMFKNMIQMLREQFQHIIIDTPPVLGFADARLAAMVTDAVILVTKQNYTHKSAGRLANQLLSQVHAPVIGAILNGVGLHASPYGGYYYYSYHQKYYSHYYSDN